MDSNVIPLSGTAIVEFTPSAFKEGDDPFPIFHLRVPTFRIRDKMAALLFQRGFIPATVSQSRGILIDALYKLYEEAEADEQAAFLESFWTRSEVHEELVNAWQIREAQRLFDRANGVGKELPRIPVPFAPYTMREQARQASIITHVLDNDERYRAYQSKFMVTEEEEEEMLVRLFIDGWTDLEGVAPERDKMDRLTLDCIEAARQKLQELGAIDGWDEVKRKVRGLFGAPKVLEKNSDSPLDLNSNLTGSPVSSGELAISGGSSTTSPIGRTRPSKSKGTSAASRGSRSSKSAATAKSGRTGAPL